MAGITLAALVHADTGRLRDLAADWEKLSDELDATTEDLARGTRDLPHHWAGAASEAAQARNRQFQVEIGNIPHNFHVVAGALRLLAQQLDHCRRMAYAVVDDAKAYDLRVDLATGEITTAGPVDSDAIAAVKAAMDELALRLTRIVAQADDADRHAYEVIDGRRHHPLDPMDDELPESRPDFLLQDVSPEFRAQEWHDMHQLNRDRMITEHPELVGPAVGLPTIDRDRANRLLLARAKTAAQARRERLDVMRDGAGSRATMNTDAELAGIAEVQKRLATTPGARLLSYPPAVIGKADPKWDEFVPPARHLNS
ncbi:WXG100-like domain-containing protein [Paractinoplanes globisporus]|uniref:Outer membrane channel protein CpnT-like N-terminal domain-containing protein n=1 Tax=Paractinoplanes globisporus TaxID=113565 RepID=A0ABW6WM98_9ACTN|nr:hypothetical protein [Actinoplanes globisporus]